MTCDADRRRADQEAEAWLVRLSEKSVTTQAIRAFFDWRADPGNREAYDAAERNARMRKAAVEASEKRR